MVFEPGDCYNKDTDCQKYPYGFVRHNGIFVENGLVILCDLLRSSLNIQNIVFAFLDIN